MSNIDVTCKVRVYEKDGKDFSFGDEIIEVSSDRLDERVILRVGGKAGTEYTVVAAALIEAARKASG